MSVHRYSRTGSVEVARIARYAPSGATVSASGLQYLDVSLTNDADLAALSEYMETIGYSFVESSPAASAPDVEVGIPVRNETGAPIPANRSVAITGYSVAHLRPLVSIADKDSPSLRPALGVTRVAIADGANGSVYQTGVLTGVDTSPWSLSDVLCLGTAGAFTRPPPDSADFSGEVQHLGQVQRVHATLGEIALSVSPILIPATTFPANSTDVLLTPVTPGLGGQSARADQVSFEGGIYFLSRRATVNRIIFRMTGFGSGPSFRIGLYQSPDGGPGTALKKASATASITATGEYTVAFDEGDVSLVEGTLYVLHGRSSVGGTYSLRVYGVQPYDGLNQNVPTGLRPVSYTTAIAASGALPATFDPRESSVGAAIPTTANVIPVLRLKKV